MFELILFDYHIGLTLITIYVMSALRRYQYFYKFTPIRNWFNSKY